MQNSAPRILVVDDDPAALKAICRALRSADYEIDVSAGTRDALIRLEQFSYPVIISDQCMPDETGHDFVCMVSKRWPETVCILLTAFGSYDLALQVINRNHVFKFVEKPWNDAVLRQAVADALKKQRTESAQRELQNCLTERNRDLENLTERLHQTISDLTGQLRRLHHHASEWESLAQAGSSMLQIVHDIKGPLGAMVLSLEMMKNSPSSAGTRTLHLMDTSLQYLIRLVQKIPHYVKDVTGDLQLESTDLARLLSETAGMLQPLFDAKSLDLQLDLQPDLRVNVDRIQFARAIVNLLKNAAEATLRGFVRLAAFQSGMTATVVVEDTGPGIPEEIIGSLFSPFTTFGKSGGIGLGLAAAKAVVERHSGTITAECTGQGTRFTILLPLSPTPAGSESACADAEQ